jgi:hypothetical protein
MDLEDWYNSRNETTKNYLKSVKDSFQLDSNKTKLSQTIYRKLYSTNNENKYEEIKKIIQVEINEWVKHGKLDNIEETAGFSSDDVILQLDYCNNLFIKAFINEFVNKYGGQLKYEIINNPYKQEILSNGKIIKISDMIASDYENMNVSTQGYENVHTSNGNFTSEYNKIPFYEKAIYVKNIDRKDVGSLRNNISKVNISYKRYDNHELLTNVSYLLKNRK